MGSGGTDLLLMILIPATSIQLFLPFTPLLLASPTQFIAPSLILYHKQQQLLRLGKTTLGANQLISK